MLPNRAARHPIAIDNHSRLWYKGYGVGLLCKEVNVGNTSIPFWDENGDSLAVSFFGFVGRTPPRKLGKPGCCLMSYIRAWLVDGNGLAECQYKYELYLEAVIHIIRHWQREPKSALWYQRKCKGWDREVSVSQCRDHRAYPEADRPLFRR